LPALRPKAFGRRAEGGHKGHPYDTLAAAGAFFSRSGSGLRPPKGYGRSGHATGYGPQAGEGVSRVRAGGRLLPNPMV